jgi:PEP-CTERM motif
MKFSLVLLIIFGASLQASTSFNITATVVNETDTSTITRQILNGNPSTAGPQSLGLINFTETAGGFLPTGSNFVGFCIEPQSSISLGTSYTWTLAPVSQGADNIGGMGAAKADLLAELYGRYYPVFGASIDATTAGALQIATWEIVRETAASLNVSSGNIIFTNPSIAAELTQAQTMLNSLNGSGPKLTNLVALTAVGVQDILVQTPEPSTFAMAVAGAGLLCAGLFLKSAVRRRDSASGPLS